MSAIPKNVIKTKMTKESFKRMFDKFEDRFTNSDFYSIVPIETDIKVTLSLLFDNGQTVEELQEIIDKYGVAMDVSSPLEKNHYVLVTVTI